jgi:hypothetical protein
VDVLNIGLDIDAGQCVELVVNFAYIFGMLDPDGTEGSGILRRFRRGDAVIDVGAAKRNSQLVGRTRVKRAGIEHPESDLAGEERRTPVGDCGVEKDTDPVVRILGWGFCQLLLKIHVGAVSAIALQRRTAGEGYQPALRVVSDIGGLRGVVPGAELVAARQLVGSEGGQPTDPAGISAPVAPGGSPK